MSFTTFKEAKSDLPTYFVTWIGDPSLIDSSDQKRLGQDTNAIIELYKVIQNPLGFVCLEKHKEYYEKFFSAQGEKIQIHTVESFIKKCEEDDFLKTYVEKIKQILSTHLARGTKRDLVSIKNLFSVIIAYFGAVVADSNIRPTTDQAFSVPHADEFLLPAIDEEDFDIWLMYSPQRSDIAKYIIQSYLKNWDAVEQHLTLGDELSWHTEQDKLIFNPIHECLSMSESSHWEASQEKNLVNVKNLPLQKMYQGTHKTKDDIGQLLVFDYDDGILENKSIPWSNCKEAIKQAIFLKNIPAALYFMEKINEHKQHHLENSILNKFVTSSAPEFLEYLTSFENTQKDISKDLQEFINGMFDFVMQVYYSQKLIQLDKYEDDDQQVGEQEVEQETKLKTVVQKDPAELNYPLKVQEEFAKLLKENEYKLNKDAQELILEILVMKNFTPETKLEKMIETLKFEIPLLKINKIKQLMTPLLLAYTYFSSNQQDASERQAFYETLDCLDKFYQHDKNKFFQSGKLPECLEFLLELRKNEKLFPGFSKK
jgi:hypothetical protein